MKKKHKMHYSGKQIRKKQRHQTPYDDAFRTLATKRSEMLIAVVNEMFDLNLPQDTPISLRNDVHFLGGQRIETDTLFQIGEHLFHIECQSNPDSTISVRIIEYDFIAVLESARKSEDGVFHLRFPRSGIIMLRHNSHTADPEKVILHFSDGDEKEITFKVMKVQNYGIDEIFDKGLYFILPFYIMRYENIKKLRGAQRNKLKMQMLDDISFILNRLYIICKNNSSLDIFEDIREMIQIITRFLFHDPEIRKDVDKLSRGRLFKLPSDKLKKAEARGEAKGKAIGEAQGEARGKANMQSDIQIIAPLLMENKDDSAIASITGWTSEKVAEYRSLLSVFL